MGSVIELRTGGPALMLGDCLAPTIILRYPGDTGLCPTCGEPAVDATGPGGGLMHATMIGGIAYGMGVLVPCGHEIGAIDIDEPETPAAVVQERRGGRTNPVRSYRPFLPFRRRST